MSNFFPLSFWGRKYKGCKKSHAEKQCKGGSSKTDTPLFCAHHLLFHLTPSCRHFFVVVFFYWNYIYSFRIITHIWQRNVQLAYSWDEYSGNFGVTSDGVLGGGLFLCVCCRTKKQMAQWLWKSKIRCVFMNFMLIGYVNHAARG